MIPFASPLLHAAAVPGGKTYDEWLAHIATRAPAIVGEASNIATIAGSNGTFLSRVQMSTGAGSGSLLGTPFWGADDSAGIFGASRVQRVFQQALPSQSQYDEQKASARIILVEVVRSSNAGDPFVVFGVSRNGLTSSDFSVSTGDAFFQIGGGANGSQGQGASVGISYWDASLGRPMSFFPRAKIAGYGPFDYTATGW